MKNQLIDISIRTGIGNLPAIFNQNNEYIKTEFDSIRSEFVDRDVLTIDVSCNNTFSNVGTFNKLVVDSIAFNNVDLSTYVRNVVEDKFGNSINEIKKELTRLDYSYQSNATTRQQMNNYNILGASTTKEVNNISESYVSTQEYDMTSFFSTNIKGQLKNITIDELNKCNIYRIIDNVKVPLSICSVLYNGKVKPAIYHDHITVKPGFKAAERVFVVISNGSDKKSIVQYGPAETVKLT